MEQTRRSAICELRRAGHTPLKIIKLLKYPRQTVYDVCKRLDEMGKEQRSAHNSRRDRILKPTFLAGLKRSIKANPAVPMTELEKKRSVSVMTIKRGINKLGFNSYARGKKHLLTEKMKEIHFNWCKLILNLLKSNPSKIKFFSDEKIFTVDRASNRRNGCLIASSSKEVFPVMSTKILQK